MAKINTSQQQQDGNQTLEFHDIQTILKQDINPLD